MLLQHTLKFGLADFGSINIKTLNQKLNQPRVRKVFYKVAPPALFWNNTSAGLVTMLIKGTVIGTPHFTPPCHVPMWFYLGGVESLPNFEVTVTFWFRKVTTRPLQNFLNMLHEGEAAILPINDIILT